MVLRATTALQTILFQNFQNLNIVNDTACRSTAVDDPNQVAGEQPVINSPNPFTESTTITYKSKGGHTLVQIIDMLGRVIKTPVDRDHVPGTYTTVFNSGELPNGVYYARLQNGPKQQVRPMLKLR